MDKVALRSVGWSTNASLSQELLSELLGRIAWRSRKSADADNASEKRPEATVRRREVRGRAGSGVFSLPEVFDLTLEQLYGSASGDEQKGPLLAQIYGTAFDGIVEAPDAYFLSQGTVQVSPV